jgi:hypothetical protein
MTFISMFNVKQESKKLKFKMPWTSQTRENQKISTVIYNQHLKNYKKNSVPIPNDYPEIGNYHIDIAMLNKYLKTYGKPWKASLTNLAEALGLRGKNSAEKLTAFLKEECPLW